MDINLLQNGVGKNYRSKVYNCVTLYSSYTYLTVNSLIAPIPSRTDTMGCHELYPDTVIIKNIPKSDPTHFFICIDDIER